MWPTLIAILVTAAVVLAVAVAVHIRARVAWQARAKASATQIESLQAAKDELEAKHQALAEQQRKARLQEQWREHLFNNSKDMVLVYGVTADSLPDHFCDVNDVACEKLEYSRDDLLAMNPLDIETVRATRARIDSTHTDLLALSNAEILGHDDQLAVHDRQTMIRQIMRNKELLYDGSFITRTGRMIPVELTARLLERQGLPVIVTTAHDVTTRRKTERALQESEQRFRDFFANSPIGVAAYDAEQDIVNVNASCLKMFGCPDREEFARFDLFDNPYLPDSAREALSHGETVRCEMVVDFEDVVNRGLFVTRNTGRSYFDILINNLGLDHDFNPRGHLVQVQDITMRRQAEAALRQSERQLRQAQKMEAIGTLAGGIAHDFNNILTPILGYTEMTLDMCEKGSDMQEFVQEINKAAIRARELVDQILTFSRQAEPDGKPIRITSIVKEVLKQEQASLPPGIELQYSIRTQRDLVLATPTQLHQVLLNLCTNAVHAMRATGGLLDVTMTSFVLGHRYRSEFPQLEPGTYIRLTVSDTGTGMNKATAERVFEPFYTTKPSGEGTGMGLAVVHGVVSSLKGTITVESELGKGTSFHVILPTIEEVAQAENEDAAPLPVGDECILFVDDETVITKMAARMLSLLGYRSVITNDSLRALDLFEQNPDRFDIVITDQVMPEMPGDELARRLLALRPALPIILCTGFSERFTAEQAQAAGIAEFLMKPLAMRDLAESIHRSLGKDAASTTPAAGVANDSPTLAAPTI